MKKIKRLGQEGGATIHGDQNLTINEVVKRTYKSIKGGGDKNEAHNTSGDYHLEAEDFSGATDLATMKKLQLAERQAAQVNSVYDSAYKGLLIKDEM